MLNASSRLALLTGISVGTKRRMLPVPLLSRAFELVWRRRVHHPDVSRLVEFQRESPCLMEHARSDWMRVHDSCGNRAAPVKDIQAQFCAAREGTGCVDHAAVVTHLDGPEISGKCTERIWAAHEEWSAVRNPLAPPMLSPVDRIRHSLIRCYLLCEGIRDEDNAPSGKSRHLRGERTCKKMKNRPQRSFRFASGAQVYTF
jgi:hypothetical protein